MQTCTMIFILLFAFCCGVEQTGTEQHTLQYLYTLCSASDYDPEFEITTVFDGLIISHCKSPTFRDQSRHDWIHQAFTVEEWKSRDRFCEGEYHLHKSLKQSIEQKVNTTNAIIQRERSCTADGSSVFMSDRWGVNGEDFLTLDPNTLEWSSDSSLASDIPSEWNQMQQMFLSLRHFELNWCKSILMKLKKMKSDYLKQNPRPEVYVFGKSSPDRNTVCLRCYISHKYLPGIRVRLTLDGVVVDKNINISSPAPNMDGTVQIRLQTETSIKEPDRYHCVVNTDSLHVSTGWDGQILDKKTFDQRQGYSVFGWYDFTKEWIALILVLSIGLVTAFAVLVTTVSAFVCQKDHSQRNIKITEEVKIYLRYVPTQEEWEIEAKVDDEFFSKILQEHK